MKILLGVVLGVILMTLVMCQFVSHVTGIRLKHMLIMFIGSMAMVIGVPDEMVTNVMDKLMSRDRDFGDTLLKFKHLLETPTGELIEECDDISK